MKPTLRWIVGILALPAIFTFLIFLANFAMWVDRWMTTFFGNPRNTPWTR